jgi:hypothetical protein
MLSDSHLNFFRSLKKVEDKLCPLLDNSADVRRTVTEDEVVEDIRDAIHEYQVSSDHRMVRLPTG